MNGSKGPLSGAARSVLREIDHELNRLDNWEMAAARERSLLLSARAALAGTAGAAAAYRRRVSQDDVAAYLAEHPGSSPADIADSLQVPATNVSTHLHRRRNTRYERREDGWYLRAP
jgi:DNA-directed RNA polymerase specialized sigma24 family protein